MTERLEASLGGRQDAVPGARRRTSLCGDAPERRLEPLGHDSDGLFTRVLRCR
jgi:hypothetical protein